MENKEKVFEAFKNSEEPLRPGAIVEMTGLEKKDVDKAIKELKKEEKIFSPKRCFYDAVK